jgi:hypothetical protein
VAPHVEVLADFAVEPGKGDRGSARRCAHVGTASR